MDMMLTIAAFALAGVAVLLLAGALWERGAEGAARRRSPPPGRMVEVAPGRRVHLIVKGEGPGPAVVFEQGAGGPGAYWWQVADEVSRFAGVCVYDRAGLGWSDAAPLPRTMPERVADLAALLRAAEIPGPYVLVGHSYGGPLISLFARDYPELVAGMVFADTPDMEHMLGMEYAHVTGKQHLPMLRIVLVAARFGLVRLIGRLTGGGPFVPAGLSPEAKAALMATHKVSGVKTAIDDIVSLHTAGDDVRRPLAPGALGGKPVAVISHDQPFPGPFALLEQGFPESQARLAALSTNSVSVTAVGAGHLVQLDAPVVVVDAIRRVHAAARDGGRL